MKNLTDNEKRIVRILKNMDSIYIQMEGDEKERIALSERPAEQQARYIASQIQEVKYKRTQHKRPD